MRIVFVPALFCDERSWEPVLRVLDGVGKVVHVPPPTTLLSDDPASALALYEDALVERSRGDDPFMLVGHSLGGYVAARALARVAPAHCVFIAGCARLPASLVSERSAFACEIEAGRVPASAVIGALGASAVGNATITPENAAILERMLGVLTAPSLVAGLRLTEPLALPGREAAPFRTPATILHGRGDTSVPFECGEELARLGRSTRIVAIDTSSHMLPLTHVDLVASAIGAAARELQIGP
jgi:pimeloyl-ACP methyl ester carboxylesterase